MQTEMNTIGNGIVKFYLISHSNGQDRKIISAKSRYEAVGFYLWEEVLNISGDALDRGEILPIDQMVVFTGEACPHSQTLEEIYADKDDWISPKLIVSLQENITLEKAGE